MGRAYSEANANTKISIPLAEVDFLFFICEFRDVPKKMLTLFVVSWYGIALVRSQKAFYFIFYAFYCFDHSHLYTKKKMINDITELE